MENKTNNGVRKFNVCMLCDFFYPQSGGVESHLYILSQCLIRRGHKVVICCMVQNDFKRIGVRYMLNGLKVYYVPLRILGTRYGRVGGSFWWNMATYVRDIVIRENIHIVHSHQGTSIMCMTGTLHAQVLGIPTVYTEHSLHGFGNLDTLWLNKGLRYAVAGSDHFVTCSHIGKENICLRFFIPPERISVIPHAVDVEVFKPFDEVPESKLKDRITISVVTRLTVRKGADLLLQVIKTFLSDEEYRNKIKFLIAGDGDRSDDFTDLIEKEGYSKDDIEMLGRVDNSKVPEVLNRGDVFLNCSLTEIFCIAIIEAAACGLNIVATNVGGVSEILPDDMIKLCDPNPPDMVRALKDSFLDHNKEEREDRRRRKKFHERISSMYNWDKVAERTDRVYAKVFQSHKKRTITSHINDVYQQGFVYGKGTSLVIASTHLIMKFLRWLKPDDEIDRCLDPKPLRYIYDYNDESKKKKKEKKKKKKEEEEEEGEEEVFQKIKIVRNDL